MVYKTLAGQMPFLVKYFYLKYKEQVGTHVVYVLKVTEVAEGQRGSSNMTNLDLRKLKLYSITCEM